MPIPKLTREVELPAPRSSGAAVVLVAAMAMFTAIGASAFVVRGMQRDWGCPARRSLPGAGFAPFTHSRPLTDAEVDIRQKFLDAARSGDNLDALRHYDELPADSPVLHDLAEWREDIADEVEDRERDLIASDVEAGRCAEARARRDELANRLPDRRIGSLVELVGVEALEMCSR